MRWCGFPRIRSQVCKRLERRLRELGIQNLNSYRSFLEENPEESGRVDFMCRVTISHFFRDRAVFEALRLQVLPEPAMAAKESGRVVIKSWSAGCASGEEVYTLKIIAQDISSRNYAALPLEITATDYDPEMLTRARHGLYSRGSLKALPARWLNEAFDRAGEMFLVKDRFPDGITWLQQVIRREAPRGPLDIVPCRNLVFTCLEIQLQVEILERLASALHPGGALVLGTRESLPTLAGEFSPWLEKLRVYRRKP